MEGALAGGLPTTGPIRYSFPTTRRGAAGVRHPIGIFVRLRLGIASGFTSELMAAFRSEKVAGFVGIRRLRDAIKLYSGF